jgi:hypothetical protein
VRELLILAGVASFAFAENSGMGQMPKMSAGDAQRMVLEVNPNGKVLMRGTVVTTATGTVTVQSWGGNWIVNVLPTSTLVPGTGMTTGDFVGVQGQINTTAPWTIDATLVRDWSVKMTEQVNRQEIKGMMPRNWEGVASNVNATANTLTLTVDGTAYNIALAANVKVVNKLFVTLPFSSVQNGDTVRVYGTNVSGTVTAIVVRDTSK